MWPAPAEAPDELFESTLSLPWSALPNYCFLGPSREFCEEHACLVRVTSIVPHRKRLRHLVEASGKDSRRVANILAVPKSRADVHPVSSMSYLTAVETPICPLYEILSSTACFLLKETARREYLEWDVIGGSVSDLNGLTKKLKQGGIGAKMIKAEKINGGRTLTIRQEEILRQAYLAGFFESPHKTAVRQLAIAMGCAPSTLVRLLRKAEKKAVADKLGLP